jgi:hypothetical protein
MEAALMYEQYTVSCNNPACYAYLRLPSDQIFVPVSVPDGADPEEIDAPEQTLWPPEEWRASIACARCRSVHEYEADEVHVWFGDKREKQPKCLNISTGCARSYCKLAFQFFIAPVDEQLWGSRASAEDIDFDGDIVSLLREGLIYGKCPHGHEFGMLPKELYKVTLVSGAIPSQHENLNWVQHSSRLIGTNVRTPVRRNVRRIPGESRR